MGDETGPLVTRSSFPGARLRTGAKAAPARISLSDEGVFAGDRLVVRRAGLERAVVSRDAFGWIVALGAKRGRVSILEVRDEEQGRSIVAALGLDAAHAASSFRFDSPLQTWAPYVWILLVVPIPFLLKLAGAPALGIPALLAWYVLAVVAGSPTHLDVGLDGVVIRWLHRRTRVRFEELRATYGVDADLVIERTRGPSRSLSLRWSHFDQETSGKTGFASKTAYLDAIVKRIHEAAAASHERRRPIPKALARGSRDVTTWVRALRSLTSGGAAGFRDPATVVDRLWGTVEDGGAPETARAAAAIALGPALGDSDRDRLRAASRLVVSPRLRVALTAASERDEAASIEALAELERDGDDAIAAKRVVSSY